MVKKYKKMTKEMEKRIKNDRPDMKAMPAIVVKDLNVYYNKGKSNEMHALKNVSAIINRGEYVIFFGPSGCGKTTLLFSIAGLQPATTGSIYINMLNIAKEPRDSEKILHMHRHVISIIFQAFHLIPSLSVLKNVELPAIFINKPAGQRRKKARELLERFGIAAQENKLPSQLSGGQKQRVAISRALMNDPQILFADEPVGNLDSKSAGVLLNILRDLNEKEGRTIILVTHDHRHLAFADKIFHMKDGVIVREEINKHKTYKIEEPEEARRLHPSEPEPKREVKDPSMKGVGNKGNAVAEKIERTPELRALMRSYKDLATLGAPRTLQSFKVGQFVQDILLSLTNHQVKVIEDAVWSCFKARTDADYETLKLRLSAHVRDGGAGLDKRTASHIVDEVASIVREVNYLDEQDRASGMAVEEEAEHVYHFLVDKYLSKGRKFHKERLIRVIIKRLKHQIDGQIVRDELDKPLKQGGVGLNIRTARGIARDLELIMLLRFKKK